MVNSDGNIFSDCSLGFFFNDTATPEIYPLSLHDALPIAASPAEAMHPHSEQTGRPPNWQGEIVVARSAEIQAVTCAKMHSRGAAGGCRNPSRTTWGISTLAYSVRSSAISETTLTRSSAERRSRQNWSSWGVN